jgi:hypothetical protein
VLSSFARRFAMSAPAYQLLTCRARADYYDAAMHLAARIGADFPLDSLWSAMRPWSRISRPRFAKSADFLGLDWTPAMQVAPRRGARRLAAETPGHWRWYAEPLAAVLPTLAPWVDTFGYAST